MAFGGDDAESYYDEGLTASMRGDLLRAVQSFEQTIRLDNTMAAAYHQLGKCRMRLGQSQAAVVLLRQVVGKRPDQVAPRVDLGTALLEVGNYEEARGQFRHALGLVSTSAKALLGLAQADFYEGDWAASVARAQEALQHGGANFSVLFMLGRAAALSGDLELSQRSLVKADGLIEKYLETNPEKPEGHFLRGDVAFVGEKFPAALRHFRDAEDHAEEGRMYLAYGESFNLADILGKQGLCVQRLGRPERARELSERILTMDPKHPIGLSLRDG